MIDFSVGTFIDSIRETLNNYYQKNHDIPYSLEKTAKQELDAFNAFISSAKDSYEIGSPKFLQALKDYFNSVPEKFKPIFGGYLPVPSILVGDPILYEALNKIRQSLEQFKILEEKEERRYSSSKSSVSSNHSDDSLIDDSDDDSPTPKHDQKNPEILSKYRSASHSPKIVQENSQYPGDRSMSSSPRKRKRRTLHS